MPHRDIDSLLQAYNAAGRALDVGMRRRGGATNAEWQAEDDARIELRAARRAYVAGIVEMIEESAAYQRHAEVGGHACDRKGRPAKVVDESGHGATTTAICPTCSVCATPQVLPGP